MSLSSWRLRLRKRRESLTTYRLRNKTNPARIYPISAPILPGCSPHNPAYDLDVLQVLSNDQAESSTARNNILLATMSECTGLEPVLPEDRSKTSSLHGAPMIISRASLAAMLEVPTLVTTSHASRSYNHIRRSVSDSNLSSSTRFSSTSAFSSGSSSSSGSNSSSNSNSNSNRSSKKKDRHVTWADEGTPTKEEQQPGEQQPGVKMECCWPTGEFSTKAPRNKFAIFTSSAIEEFQTVQRAISMMCMELAEIEAVIFLHEQHERLSQFSDDNRKILKNKIFQFEQKFEEFADDMNSQTVSGLTSLLSESDTTVHTLWKELSRLLFTLRQRSIRFFGFGMAVQYMGAQCLVQNGGVSSPFPPNDAPGQDLTPSMAPMHMNFAENPIIAVQVLDFMGKRGSNIDIFHFGVVHGSTEEYVPIRWTAAAAAGSINSRSITLEHLKKHVSQHIRIADGTRFDLWCHGQMLTEECFNEMVFSHVQNMIAIIVDPKITVNLEIPESGLVASLVIDFSNQYMNKADAPLRTIKQLVVEHLQPIWNEMSASIGKGKAKDGALENAEKLHLYCGDKLLTAEFLPLREACLLPIRKLEGLDDIKISASYNLRKRECTVCKEFQFEADFPEGKVTNSCSHSSNTCFSCLETWIDTFMSNWKIQNVTCPQCTDARPMTKDEVVAVLRNIEKQDQYIHLFEVNKISQESSFVWCCAIGCNSGQIHTDSSKPMTCILCKAVQCTKHNVSWDHGGTITTYEETGKDVFSMLCDKFEEEVVNRIHAADTRATEETVSRTTKACRRCSARIEKNDGCDHMTCHCGQQFCWDCGADWGPAANNPSLHLITCQYFPQEELLNRRQAANAQALEAQQNLGINQTPLLGNRDHRGIVWGGIQLHPRVWFEYIFDRSARRRRILFTPL